MPVDEDVVEMEVHDKVGKRLLDAGGGRILAVVSSVAGKDADGVGRLSVRHGWCAAEDETGCGGAGSGGGGGDGRESSAFGGDALKTHAARREQLSN